MRRTDNQHKFDLLRKEFSSFTFERQTVKRYNGMLSLAFDFNLDNRYHFRPTLEIPARPFFDWESIPDSQLEALAFQIGMTELVSYWKIACPKQVLVKPFALTASQKAFWKKLYYNGLGEFLYLNSITVSEEELMELESEGERFAKVELPLKEKTLVPIGGGKDSVVTLECLRDTMPVTPLIVNPRGATLNCVHPRPDHAEIERGRLFERAHTLLSLVGFHQYAGGFRKSLQVYCLVEREQRE